MIVSSSITQQEQHPRVHGAVVRIVDRQNLGAENAITFYISNACSEILTGTYISIG